MTNAPNALDNIRIVMIDTTHTGNIGAAARAMRTMGLKRLYLVNPYRELDDEARRRASGADDVMDGITITETLEEAIGDCHLVIGTSARQRRIPWPNVDSRQGGRLINESLVGGQQVAVLFGREARGLTNEELQRCHYHMQIPTDASFGVLNVASAIQVITYEIRMAWLESQQVAEAEDVDQPQMTLPPMRWDAEPATTKEVDLFMEHFDGLLQRIQFYDPDNPKQLFTRMRRLFSRARMDKLEVNLMRGVFSTIDKRLAGLGAKPDSKQDDSKQDDSKQDDSKQDATS